MSIVGQVVAVVLIVSFFLGAVLYTDHLNCKERRRKLLMRWLKDAKPIPEGTWQPVWTMYAPKWLLKRVYHG